MAGLQLTSMHIAVRKEWCLSIPSRITPSRITPDGSSSSTLYNRNFWTETDPAGRSRTTTTDGLDRLAAVAENNLGTPATTLYNTAYSYDILGDLVQVNQSGQTRCAYI
jgi:hypothetical protein